MHAFFVQFLAGMARILLGKGSNKETAFLEFTPLEVCGTFFSLFSHTVSVLLVDFLLYVVTSICLFVEQNCEGTFFACDSSFNSSIE